jgi:putative zinc finger/helix-turn-helix YgiT family protein
MLRERIMKKEYCEYCDKKVSYSIETKTIKVSVLGVEVEAEVKRPICLECHEVINVKKITRENEISVYDAYKAKVGLLTSKEIMTIRKSKNLSQSDFAKKLNLGEKTITRIENGKIQSKSIDNYIRLIEKPENFNFVVKDVDNIFEEIIDCENKYYLDNNLSNIKIDKISLQNKWGKCHGSKQIAAC